MSELGNGKTLRKLTAQLIPIGHKTWICIQTSDIVTDLAKLGNDFRVVTIDPRTHTRQCLLSTVNALLARNHYKQNWPNYCRKCEGQGGFYTPGTYDDPPDADSCECTENGICPRCGQKVSEFEDGVLQWMADDLPCPHCGWNWGKNDGDVMFGEPECDCYDSPLQKITSMDDWLDLLKTANLEFE